MYTRHFVKNPAKRLLKLSSRNAAGNTSNYNIVDHTFDALVVGAGKNNIFPIKIWHFLLNLGGAGLRAAMGLSEGGLKTGLYINQIFIWKTILYN
jgi:hypothetical protein